MRGKHRGPGVQDGEQVRRSPRDRPPLRSSQGRTVRDVSSSHSLPPPDLRRQQLQCGPPGPGRHSPALLLLRPVKACRRPHVDHQRSPGPVISPARN